MLDTVRRQRCIALVFFLCLACYKISEVHYTCYITFEDKLNQSLQIFRSKGEIH